MPNLPMTLDDLPKREWPVKETQDSDSAFRVLMSEKTRTEIWEHAQGDLTVELCGILIGTPCRDDAGPFVLIDGSIRGEKALSEGTRVTFTHQTWQHFYEVLDRDFPEKQIVGWYHTHPGFGVFLSSMDTFIHENFFSAPWQLALVVDPKAHKESFFAQVDGSVCPLSEYWVRGQSDFRRIKCIHTPRAADRNEESPLDPLLAEAIAIRLRTDIDALRGDLRKVRRRLGAQSFLIALLMLLVTALTIYQPLLQYWVFVAPHQQ